MIWPPKTKRSMLLWQREHGYDTKIARAVGIAKHHVARQRNKFGVEPLNKGRDKYPYQYRPKLGKNISEKEISALYAGHEYQDVNTKKGPVHLTTLPAPLH